ncbi:hypothetical protein Tco_0592606, partial [Tanacetum coccineum]
MKTAITPMETKVALTKDKEAVDVDVHLYRSMISHSKTSHLNAVRESFKYLKGKPQFGLYVIRENHLLTEAFSDSDYGGSNLDKNPVYHSKTKHIEIRHHFIRDCYEKKLIRVEKIHTDLNVADLLTKPFDGPRNSMDLQMYALTNNLTIHDSLVKQFWQTATAKTLADETLELKATIDTIEYTIIEASIRSKLQLADASGITMLPNNEIFEGMGHMGYPIMSLLPFEKLFHTPIEILRKIFQEMEEFKNNLLGTGLDFGDVKYAFENKKKRLKCLEDKRTKEQILQEEAGLAEAIRLDALEKALEKEEVAKQVHLDSLLAQRMAEEQELTEEQKKRKAQVQFEAQSYTEEDWDTIRAKLEANAELRENVLGKDLSVEDYAKRMVELVNQRRKHFAEERARAKRNKPMTQTQLRNYMSNFLKNQGTWKLTQLKKLNFEEVKAEFEKLIKQLDTYVPMNLEATKENEKAEEDKDDKPTKKTGKRRKQIARKGLDTDLDKDDSEDSDEASEKDDSTSGIKIPINPVPVAIKSPSIASYKIIKQGMKGVYQIVRENGSDKLYRIVMRKHGMNEPEDDIEKVLWEYLKNMFEEPLSTDSIWSLPGQQRLICWRYYEACRVHCLNLESVDIYMLIERKYPLSAEVCKAMLDKKLQGGKPDEDCYKLLKMMEKQAGIRKHKDWLVQEQTALGKDFSNPLMADNLPKIVWLSTHHIWIAMYEVSRRLCGMLSLVDPAGIR